MIGNKIHFKHKLKGKLRHANLIYIKTRLVSKILQQRDIITLCVRLLSITK